jgi:hypothetical protein
MTSCVANKSLRRSGILVLALGLSAGALPALAATAPPAPISPGYTRIWLYRNYEPLITLDTANVELNGARLASVPPHDGAQYRDIPAGSYRLSVENSTDKNKSKDVALAPGQQVFAKITTSDTWLSGGGGQGARRENYDLKLEPAGQAQADMARQP